MGISDLGHSELMAGDTNQDFSYESTVFYDHFFSCKDGCSKHVLLYLALKKAPATKIQLLLLLLATRFLSNIFTTFDF